MRVGKTSHLQDADRLRCGGLRRNLVADKIVAARHQNEDQNDSSVMDVPCCDALDELAACFMEAFTFVYKLNPTCVVPCLDMTCSCCIPSSSFFLFIPAIIHF